MCFQSVSSGVRRARMTSSDRSLERVRARSFTELLRPLECGETTANEELVPERAILIEQQDGLARRTDAGLRPRGLDFHQRDQAVDLGLLRSQPGQDASQAQRVFAERGPHPVFARRRGVALIEDEVDDLEHRRQTRGALGAARNLEGNALLGERPLGADDALSDGRLGDEEGAGDLRRW